METLCHNSIANTYAVDSEKYCFTLLKDMAEASASFSVSTWDVLRGNKIYFVSDLLNHSVIQLMNLDGFTDEALREIQSFVSMLQKDHPLPPQNVGEQEEPDKADAVDLQKLKECRIVLPIDIPFAQKHSITPSAALNAHLFKIDLPDQIRKKLVIAGFNKINDVLMLSPDRMIREAGITLLDLPKVENCISSFVREAYGSQKDAAEDVLMPIPPAAAKTVVICADEQKTQENAEHPSEIVDEKPVPVENDKTYAQIYSLNPDLFRDDPISTLHLSVRTARVLRKDGIKTIADLLNTTPKHLLLLKNFGPSSLREAERLLNAAKESRKNEESAHINTVLPKEDNDPQSSEPSESMQDETTEQELLLQSKTPETKPVSKTVSSPELDNVSGETNISNTVDLSVPASEPPTQNEHIEQTEMEEDAHQPQASKNEVHAIVDVPAEDSEKTYAEIFGIQPEHFANTSISELNLSVQTHNERIGQTEMEEDAHQPQTSKNEVHAVVDVPAEDSEKTYAEIFGLNPEHHANTSISELDLSVRTHNVFKRNGINTLDVLLKKSPESLMQLKNFGKTSLQDVEKLMKLLKGSSPATKTSSPIQIQSSESIPLELRPFARRMANGDFSFMEDPAIPAHILPTAELYREAQMALGTELANACLDTPQSLQTIISACFAFRFTVQQQNDLQVLIDAIPPERRCNKVYGYINAYVKNEEKRANLQNLYSDADATVCSILNATLNDEQYRLVSAFLRWCSYDLSVEINTLLKSVYTNDRMKTVIQMRAQKKTLEQIGTILGVTRERVRQIEMKAKRIFQSRQGRIKIISKIAADLNSSSVVMPGDLMDYCGSLFDEVLFLLRTCESSNFTYDQTLDLFIVGDDSLQDRTTAFIESLPEIIPANALKMHLKNAEEEYDLTEELAQIAISEAYQQTGDVYHRSRLSMGAIYTEILSEYYPDGIHVYDPNEMAAFRQRVIDKYGHIKLSNNDRALAARIAGICTLCGKGRYRLKQKNYISRPLARQIYQYIENSDHSIFMTNTLFHVFEDDLRASGVDNKYYLQGILHELYGDQYTFTRDYISKDASITSIYSSVVNHIKKSQHPVSKKQLKKAFPGVPEVALNLATSDPEVLQYLGEYLHSSKLAVTEQEKAYLHSVVARLLKDGQPHHSEEFHAIVMMERPEIFTRNAVSFQYRCFSVLEYLFRNQYEFSRPYIAPLGIEVGRPIEQLREFVDGNDMVSITEISSYAAEIHFRLPSTLGFVNSCNDRYLLISNEIMMLQEDTGVDESIARLVEDLVCEEITDTALIRSLPCWMRLPSINVPWTEWLVYSVLNKWATRVEVAPSYNQFRMAIPLVAPKGKMQAEPFAEVYKELDCTAGDLSVSISNDLDHIDDLLMELTDDELLEDDLWD